MCALTHRVLISAVAILDTPKVVSDAMVYSQLLLFLKLADRYIFYFNFNTFANLKRIPFLQHQCLHMRFEFSFSV